MYVGAVGKMIPAQMHQVAGQPESDNSIHAVSMEGKAEYKEKKNPITSENVSLAEKQVTDNEKIKKAIEKMNAQLPNSEAKFGIHEATNRVMIKLVDKDTQEVIKEIPPEKTLDMIAKCMEMAGVLVDEKL